MNILKTQELAVGYGSKTVVDGINLEALKGQLICLLGPNGSGKSTILRSLSGLLAPVHGTIYLKGQLLPQLKLNELAKTLAVVLTERISPGLMTVFEIAAMGRYPYTGFFGRLSESDINKTWEALRLVNAENIAERYFNELSDGERQKALLARALVQEPELIVLDEPTTHLDVRHRIEILSILSRLAKEKGITVILSLHEVDLALKSCETVILVKNGKILAVGPPEDVIKEETITELYDISCAHFNDFLGTMELLNNSSASVFVIAGAGSGTRLYRMLTKHGYGIYTGVIHENDVDYHVAQAIGAVITSEKSFEEISHQAFSEAEKFIQEARQIVDAGFPVGLLNRRNRDLIIHALQSGKTVYTLRDKKEGESLYGHHAQQLVYCECIASVIEHLSHAHLEQRLVRRNLA